jgi:NADH dehydrogenase
LRQLRGEPPHAFRYRDRGTMATIGRRMAVAHVYGLTFSGLVAWVLWLSAPHPAHRPAQPRSCW